MTDRVTLINQNDEVLGEMDKLEAHRGEGKLHRAVSVFLFRKNTAKNCVELLIQKRSHTKIVGADQWANTACGNVWPGEAYQECAKRRLAGELGIVTAKIQLLPIDKFQYQVRCNQEFSENELDQVFAGWYDGKLTPNTEEVVALEWTAWDDLMEELRVGAQDSETQKSKDWAPWFEIIMKKSEIVEKLSQFMHQGEAYAQ